MKKPPACARDGSNTGVSCAQNSNEKTFGEIIVPHHFCINREAGNCSPYYLKNDGFGRVERG